MMLHGLGGSFSIRLISLEKFLGNNKLNVMLLLLPNAYLVNDAF